MFPYSIKFILNCLKIIGFINLNDFKHTWQNQLMKVYCFLFHCFYMTMLSAHLIGIITRSFQYLPEFYDRLLDNVTMSWIYIECWTFRVNMKSFENLMDYMTNNFSAADESLSLESHKSAIFFFRFLVVFGLLALVTVVVETQSSLSSAETVRLGEIYKRSRPERRLPTIYWIPFVDDSESPAYEILFVTIVYIVFNILMMGLVCTSVIPMIVKYQIGQYDILCKYLEMLGHTHLSPEGDRIYYTNIETNSYVRSDVAVQLEEQVVDYDRYFCRQLILFHHKLIDFQTRVSFLRGLYTLKGFYLPYPFVGSPSLLL